MFCSNCGKEYDNDDKYCKHCGYQIVKEEAPENTNYIKPQINESRNGKNIIIGVVTIICVIVLFYFAFSPIKFDIPIMGVSVEATVSYDFATQKAKFRIGAFGFDTDNVSPINYLDMKLNFISHFLFNSDISHELTQRINTQMQSSKSKNSSWYDRALIEYYSLEKKKNSFFLNNLLKSNAEKEANFLDLVKQLGTSAENVTNAYYNANSYIDEEYIRKYVKDFNKLGLNISFSEGYYFTPYYPYLLQTFGIPRVWKDFLEMESARQKDFGEMYCKLKADEIADVIMRYDTFIKKYPKFTYKNTVINNQNIYLYSYLHGYDNGLIFDYDTKRIKDEYKKSIENFLKEHTEFSRYNLVNEYYNRLKKNNYRINDDVSYWIWKKIYKS